MIIGPLRHSYQGRNDPGDNDDDDDDDISYWLTAAMLLFLIATWVDVTRAQAGVSSWTDTNTHLLVQCKKVKFSHSRYRALGPELIPQVTWSESRHIPSSSLPLLSAKPAFTFVAFTRWRYLQTAAHIWFQLTTQFIDPERMKGWVGLVGWPIADGSPTLVVTHQLQVERRTGKVRRPETDVLPLCHATNARSVYTRV